ncbi:MAG: polysaccharide deacetylase family protein [Gaiellaceae bacterium]
MAVLAAAAAALCGAAFLVPALDPARAAATPAGSDCSGGYLSFTFDDGPGRNTPAVLKTLDRLHVAATFFVNGDKLEASAANRRIMREELAHGFAVQNHTYDHASFTGASTGTRPLTDAQIRAELERASTAIMKAGAPRPTLYRPPYGAVNGYVDLVARHLGYRIVMPWGTPSGNIVDSLDWTGISPRTIAANVTNGYRKNGHFYGGIRAGSIVSMHDGDDTALNTIEALQTIVDAMNAKHLCSSSAIRADATGGIVPAPAPPEPKAGNLVQNPSLEALEPSASSSAEAEAVCFQHAGAKLGRNGATWSLTSDAHSGSVAQRVDVRSWHGGDRKLVVTQRRVEKSCLAAVTPGRRYSMWAWYKGRWAYSGPAPTKVSMVTYYRRASGGWIYWQSSPLLAPTSSWNLASFTSAPLPAGATGVSFGLGISGRGTLTTDDYALAASAPPTGRR